MPGCAGLAGDLCSERHTSAAIADSKGTEDLSVSSVRRVFLKNGTKSDVKTTGATKHEVIYTQKFSGDQNGAFQEVLDQGLREVATKEFCKAFGKATLPRPPQGYVWNVHRFSV